jgi:PAS domain S-box-containing protein
MSAGVRGEARGLWALWFVAAALVALAVVPAYYGRRVAHLQARVTDVLQESSSLSARLSLEKARQMARFEAFLLTGDRTLRGPYVAAIAEEDALFARLSELARDLDFDVRERLARLRVQSTAWHFENQRIFEADSIGDALARSRREFAELQRATRELDRAIQSEVAEGRREMRSLQAQQERVALGLALIALGATVVVGRVGWRFRDLAEESERRRRDAVKARREIDSLLEATGDGVLGIDLEARCTALNRAGCELLGFTEREIAGRDVHDTLFHSFKDGSPCPREASPILAALSKGSPIDSPDGAILWRRRREWFPARWSLRPMFDGTELRGAVLTFTDMTPIREKEEALKRAIRSREDVISIVSHDLRNPLGVVLAASDLLLDLPLDERERRRQAEVIRRSGKRMLGLIEDLLDVARIEAGVFVVRPSREKLLPILDEARGMFADRAAQRGIVLDVEQVVPDPVARVDRDRILQALANLVDNALRHTPEGGRVALSAQEADGFVEVSVKDNGPGIASERIATIFDRFAQGRDGGGAAGLGLAIVKGVAEAHGGSASVVSEPGRGATFTIRVPKMGPAA